MRLVSKLVTMAAGISINPADGSSGTGLLSCRGFAEALQGPRIASASIGRHSPGQHNAAGMAIPRLVIVPTGNVSAKCAVSLRYPARQPMTG